MSRFYRNEARRLEVLARVPEGVRVRIVEEPGVAANAGLLGYTWVLTEAELGACYNPDGDSPGPTQPLLVILGGLSETQRLPESDP